MSYLLVLEARGLKSRSRLGHALSEASSGGSFLVSSGFWWSLPILGISWFTDPSFQSPPLSPLCVTVSSNFFLFVKIPVIGFKALPNPV